MSNAISHWNFSIYIQQKFSYDRHIWFKKEIEPVTYSYRDTLLAGNSDSALGALLQGFTLGRIMECNGDAQKELTCGRKCGCPGPGQSRSHPTVGKPYWHQWSPGSVSIHMNHHCLYVNLSLLKPRHPKDVRLTLEHVMFLCPVHEQEQLSANVP